MLNNGLVKSKASKIGKTAAVNALFYFLLICVGFVFLYPILYMVITSLMTTEDLINPTIMWVPTKLALSNFKMVWGVLEYPKAFVTSLVFATVCALFQTVSCALMGYALARFEVPFKNLWLAILILLFVIPTDVLTIPRYVLFNSYNLIGSPLAMILPPITGQGIKSTIFVLIFMNGFASVPKSFDEAAQLDGAGRLKVFYRIAIPMAIPVITLCVIFSVVWYWNDTAQTAMLVGSDFGTLPLKLQSFDGAFKSSVNAGFGDDMNRLNECFQFAAILLTVIPLVIFYLIMQKQFVQGIESSGITGE